MYSEEAIAQLAKYDMVTIEKFVAATAGFALIGVMQLTIAAACCAWLLVVGGTPCVELNILSKALRTAMSSPNSTRPSIG